MPLWGRLESSFTANGAVTATPKSAVQFTLSCGVARTVDGFWDGKSTQRGRFMPGVAGRWTYRTNVEAEAGGPSGLEVRSLRRPPKYRRSASRSTAPSCV